MMEFTLDMKMNELDETFNAMLTILSFINRAMVHLRT